MQTEAKENNWVFTPLSRDGTHFRVIIEPEIETKNDALFLASFSKTKNELPHTLQLHDIIDIQYLVLRFITVMSQQMKTLPFIFAIAR